MSTEKEKNLRLGLLYASQQLELLGRSEKAENALRIGGIESTEEDQECEHNYSFHCERCGEAFPDADLLETEREMVEKAFRKIEKNDSARFSD